MKNLPLEDIDSQEDLDEIKANFNVPSLGKLYTSYNTIKRKKQKEDRHIRLIRRKRIESTPEWKASQKKRKQRDLAKEYLATHKRFGQERRLHNDKNKEN